MTTIYHSPPNHLETIDHLWLVISEDATGEGVVAAPIMGQLSVPLIAADDARVESIKRLARTVARNFPGKKLKLIKFSMREEVEDIEPDHG